MKVLITGGTGFIGSYVIRQLLSAGYQVLATRRPGALPVLTLTDHPTWLDRSFLDLTPSDFEGIEVVIHLASAGVSPKPASWSELEQINVAAGLQLIDLARRAGVRRFVATGTCLEYGSEANAWLHIPPSAPLRPTTAYGASKAAGFFMLQAFANANPIEFIYGRIFTAYGEGQFAGNLWPSLRAAALAGDDFPMTAGEQVRDFISVEKVAAHVCSQVDRNDVQAGESLVLNIGSGTGMSVLDFAISEWQRLNATGRLRPGAMPSRSDQIDRLVADPIHLIPALECSS